MLKFIFKYFFKNSIHPNYKEMWLEQVKSLLLSESLNIFKNLVLLQVAIIMFTLSITYVIEFATISLQSGTINYYVPLMNAAALMAIAAGIYIFIIKYVEKIKRKIEGITLSIVSPTLSIFRPILEQLLNERQDYLESSAQTH